MNDPERLGLCPNVAEGEAYRVQRLDELGQRCAHCGSVLLPYERAVAETTDPHELGGAISGPGGPHDRNSVVVDTRRAILMDELGVVELDNASDGRQLVAVLVEGRVNQGTADDRAAVMVLGDLDMLAAFITESYALASRMGHGRAEELELLCDARWARIKAGDSGQQT
jgi:hypothetical protein